MMRAVVLSEDVRGRSALVRALEEGGVSVVGEGRTVEDGRRLAPLCDVLLVEDETIVTALVGTVRRPVIALQRGSDGPPGDAHMRLAWPADGPALQAALRRVVTLLPGTAAAGMAPPILAPPILAPPILAPARTTAPPQPTRPAPDNPPTRPRVVVMAASAGGPAAIARVLADLGTLSIPVVIGQHLHPDFAASLRNLTQSSGRSVVLATPGLRLQSGTVALAGPGGDLVISADGRCAVVPPSGDHVPNLDVLLRSVASAYGAQAIGVILTGMGQDGVDGLMAMRQRGALTIAQDKATSTVYGMPAAAAVRGAASRVLPLDAIAPAVLSALGRRTA